MGDGEETEVLHWNSENNLLDNCFLNNLVSEETIRKIQWLDIPEIFKEAPLNEDNTSTYIDAAVLLIKNEMYNEDKIMLLEVTEKYPEKEEKWLALADAQWGNCDKEDANNLIRVI